MSAAAQILTAERVMGAPVTLEETEKQTGERFPRISAFLLPVKCVTSFILKNLGIWH